MKLVRLHPRVYDDIDEALAYTREQFGPRQVVRYARLIRKVARPCDCTRPSASSVKISALEYVCIASQQAESTRHTVRSTEYTRTAPSTLRASFILPDTCRTSPKGSSEAPTRAQGELCSSRCTIGNAPKRKTYKRKNAELLSPTPRFHSWLRGGILPLYHEVGRLRRRCHHSCSGRTQSSLCPTASPCCVVSGSNLTRAGFMSRLSCWLRPSPPG